MRTAVIYTIGVHGTTQEHFVDALMGHGIDLFCDLRARRGLRGRQYAFANSVRLQELLRTAGIAYRHYPEVAPTPEMRGLQHMDDRAGRVAKRGRETLGDRFLVEYRGLMAQLPAQTALREIADSAVRPCLFCVERQPTACHRSMVAAELAALTGAETCHLIP